MLRGRRSCAISGLPTPSPALQSLLTPLFPLLTRNTPVSPFFPLLTQKQGGGGPETSLFSFSANRTIARSRPLGSSRLRLCALGVLCGESLFNSGDSAPNFQIPAKNTETAYITVPLSIIILNIVGAPTCFRTGPPLSSFRIFLNLKLTTDHLKPLKSNYSRTSAKCARKSNHSRTYAKTGGWGCLRQRSSPATLLFSMATLTTQLSTIVGAPTFPFQHTVCRKQRRGRKPRSTDRNVCATRRGTQKPGRSGSICGRALEQDGIGSRDLRRGDLHEAVLLGNGKGARKVLGGDVALGFRNE